MFHNLIGGYSGEIKYVLYGQTQRAQTHHGAIGYILSKHNNRRTSQTSYGHDRLEED